RLLALVTSSEMLESTVVRRAWTWVLMRPASLRKFWTVFRAWPRSRVDDGSLAALAKAAEISSGRLKKNPLPEGSPNRLWALSRKVEVTSKRLESEPAVRLASCRYW